MKQFLRQRVSPQTINRWHKVQARLAAARFGYPAKKLTIIGVTGTNGKTSTCHYITQILEEAGHKVGMITTVAIQINGHRRLNKSKMTTLDSFQLQSLLREMVRQGCDYAVVETTSHSLEQNRVHGIYYHVAVFTNLTHDHLDYHKTMAEYQKAKEKLFANHPQVAIVNADDPAAPAFLAYPAQQKFTYGIVDRLRPKEALPHPDITASLLKLSVDKTMFLLTTPFGETNATLPLPGRFTIANVLAAVAACLSLKVPLEQIKTTLAHLQSVEGRLEKVDCGQPFSVIVDFAHTPDALQQVYNTVRPTVTGKLIAVLGATGRRDKTKRPILGALAGRYADLVFVTDEDPYTEDPKAIIDEVAAGVPRGRPNVKEPNKGEGTWWWRVLDRREAIAKALSMAKAGDMVIITGKGGEHVMAVGEKLIPYNDVKVVKEILGNR